MIGLIYFNGKMEKEILELIINGDPFSARIMANKYKVAPLDVIRCVFKATAEVGRREHGRVVDFTLPADAEDAATEWLKDPDHDIMLNTRPTN